MRQKAAAFEILSQLEYLQFHQSENREELIKKLSGQLSNWNIVQRGLVEGNEVYRISDEKSSELISKIEATSKNFLFAYRNATKVVSADDFSNVDELSAIYVSLQGYADGMNDVAGQYNKESDQFQMSNLIALLILALTTLVVLWLGMRILVIPILKKGEEAEDVKALVASELENVKAAKAEFLSNMGHELITPINGVLGMAEILGRTGLNEEQSKYVRSIKNSSNNLLNIVTDIIDHTSLEAGEIEVVKEAFNIYECMEQVIDLVKPGIGEKRIELICDLDPHLPEEIVQDERRIRQTLVNLAAHSIKNTESGNVILKVEQLHHEGEFIQIKFSISDSAQGIDIPAQRRLFANSGTEVLEGQPIALKISKQLVDKLNGRIWLEESGEKGNVISFTIVAESTGSIEMTKVTKLVGKKVLVVDTNKTALKIIVKQLSTWGMQATPFNSVELVTDMIDNLTRFDLCIIDSTTQELGGRSLAEKIRSRYAENDLPMIVTTTSAQNAIDQQGDLYTAIITKPIKQSKLLETILKVLHLNNQQDSVGVYEGAFGKKHLRILIAQDNDLSRAVTEKHLSILGHKCTAVRSGKDVIDNGVKGKFDLLIVDSSLDGMKGIDAVKHLRRITNEDDMPLVFGLSEDDIRSKKEMKQAGADEVLPSKVGVEEIQSKIEEWFEISS
ncbi:MAG: response regulator [Flavobacteriales bacterium]